MSEKGKKIDLGRSCDTSLILVWQKRTLFTHMKCLRVRVLSGCEDNLWILILSSILILLDTRNASMRDERRLWVLTGGIISLTWRTIAPRVGCVRTTIALN